VRSWFVVAGLLCATPVAAENRCSWRWRAGAQLGAGLLVPVPALAGGVGVRVGLQHRETGLLLELGGLGGFTDRGTPEDSRVNGLFAAHVTPTIEQDVAPRTFVSAGIVLGAGLWAYSKHSESPSGAVHSESVGIDGDRITAFLPGLDLRAGYRFGCGSHHLVVGIGLKLVFVDGHRATATISAAGDVTTATDRRAISVAATPMVVVGYDFMRAE
jgi:hypothetical protein